MSSFPSLRYCADRFLPCSLLFSTPHFCLPSSPCSLPIRYRLRALLLKRHGDAYLRNHGAHSDYTSVLPEDPVRGLLCLTDCSILFLYCYWCEEQASGRVRSSPYTESQPLRDVIRRAWESEAKRATDEEDRERAKAMIGLMYVPSVVLDNVHSC